MGEQCGRHRTGRLDLESDMQTLLERALLKGLRNVSPWWRAHTELFVDPYRNWIDWRSGLGEGGRLLYAIARMTRPAVIAEIGSARGNSTCSLALACAENARGIVYAIDPHISNEWTDVGTGGNTYDFLQQRLKVYELDSCCSVIRKTSVEAAKTWDRTIDLLFIDGDHSLEGVSTDFELFGPWLNDGGMVIFHDTTWEHERPWKSYSAENWYRDDMGVPACLAELRKKGYESFTFMPVPGLTIMHPRSGDFDFLRGRTSSEAASSER
jgi:predicted O-methyltransferase YrrM